MFSTWYANIHHDVTKNIQEIVYLKNGVWISNEIKYFQLFLV